jgi:hypothetical protein
MSESKPCRQHSRRSLARSLIRTVSEIVDFFDTAIGWDRCLPLAQKPRGQRWVTTEIAGAEHDESALARLAEIGLTLEEVCVGSIATEMSFRCHVRFAPDSDRAADID